MKVTNGLDLQNQRVVNVGDPSANTDATNKQYVDNVARGLDWKQPVRAASTGNITVSGPGTTIDGVSLTNGDRVLLKNQTAGAENGIYTFNGSAAALTRTLDADNGTELKPGTSVTVTEGTVNGDKVYLITSDAAITIGTTASTWGVLGGGGQAYVGINGVAVSGANISGVVKSGGGLGVDSAGFFIDTSVVSRKIAGNMGNGTLTSIAVTHNLNSTDIQVQVQIASTKEFVLADWVATDANNVTFTFPSAPAANFYRWIIQG